MPRPPGESGVIDEARQVGSSAVPRQLGLGLSSCGEAAGCSKAFWPSVSDQVRLERIMRSPSIVDEHRGSTKTKAATAPSRRLPDRAVRGRGSSGRARLRPHRCRDGGAVVRRTRSVQHAHLPPDDQGGHRAPDGGPALRSRRRSPRSYGRSWALGCPGGSGPLDSGHKAVPDGTDRSDALCGPLRGSAITPLLTGTVDGPPVRRDRLIGTAYRRRDVDRRAKNEAALLGREEGDHVTTSSAVPMRPEGTFAANPAFTVSASSAPTIAGMAGGRSCRVRSRWPGCLAP